jgi:hypothetical protein
LTRFFLTLAIVSCILVGAAMLLVHRHWVATLPSYFYQTLIFLLFGTSVLFVYLYRFNKPDFFVHLYLLSMVVKLIAYGAYNFVMILDDKNGATQNIVWFGVLYFIFTALEIGFLYRRIAGQ